MTNAAKVRETLQVGTEKNRDDCSSWIARYGLVAFDMLVELRDTSRAGFSSYWEMLQKQTSIQDHSGQLVLAAAWAFPNHRDELVQSLRTVWNKDSSFSGCFCHGVVLGAFLAGTVVSLSGPDDVIARCTMRYDDALCDFLGTVVMDDASLMTTPFQLGGLSNAIGKYLEPDLGMRRECHTHRRIAVWQLLKSKIEEYPFGLASWDPERSYRGAVRDKLSRKLLNSLPPADLEDALIRYGNHVSTAD